MRPAALTACVAAALVLAPLSRAPRAAQQMAATTSRTFTNPSLGLTAVAADLTLPPGDWDVLSVTPTAALDQVELVSSVAPGDPFEGRRMGMATTQRSIEQGRSYVYEIFWACEDFASSHGGVGPASFADLDVRRWGPMTQNVSVSPWPDDAGRPVPGPFLLLLPSVPMTVTHSFVLGQSVTPPSTPPRRPLIFELRPYVDDGKQWVLFSDGSTERLPVNTALMAEHRVTLSFVRSAAPSATADAGAARQHTLIGLLRGSASATATVTLVDGARGGRTVVAWTLAGGRPDAQLLGAWANARAQTWRPLLNEDATGILRAWSARLPGLYGARPEPPNQMPMFMRGFGRTPSTFGVLGGRAALQETIQLEAMRGVRSSLESPRIPMSMLKGLDVRSLPFEQLLAGRAGGRLPIADYVPADRLLVYFAKPSALFPFLDHGTDFLGDAGSLASATAFDDDLKGRYMRRLGMNEGLARTFLNSGEVTELALLAPDVFFLDGTDLTVVMRLRSPDRVAATLALLGVGSLESGGVTERTASGHSTFWSRRADLLCVSSSRAELDHVLAVGGAGGAGSLGQSAELRYMLSELPIRAETRAFIYFSDPFIRRLVGPAMKIGQLRRLRARADMQAIVSGALLAAADGHHEPPDLTRLAGLGYITRELASTGYRLQPDLTIASPQWGSLADMHAIDTSAIDTVTSGESQAYQDFVAGYQNYWRQYFDPIGLRLDDGPGGALELSTFILPLIDNSLYNQLRNVLGSPARAPALRVPKVSPQPLMMLSLNLTDDAWVGVTGAMNEWFTRYAGIDARVFDLMGPGVHLAVQDADPVIASGTADLLGAFGMTSGPGLNVIMPFALSLLTRPCKVLVELQDPQQALALLRRAAQRPVTIPGMGPMAAFRQIDGRDAWVFTMGMAGLATIRLGLEVDHGYLVLSNIPWSQPVTITSVEPRPLNGAALQVAPDAVQLGLAGLFATQAEQNQTAALASMAALYPFLAAGTATPAEAALRHAAVFGSMPLHPGPGSWNWANGRLESTVYGDAAQWKEPRYSPDAGSFGLFKGLSLIDLNVQLESGGLRATCRWVWSGR